jgi:hypothetical protein
MEIGETDRESLLKYVKIFFEKKNHLGGLFRGH